MLGQPSTPTRKRITAAAVSLPGMPGTGACTDDAYNLDTPPRLSRGAARQPVPMGERQPRDNPAP